jgi:hypothetical protein
MALTLEAEGLEEFSDGFKEKERLLETGGRESLL